MEGGQGLELLQGRFELCLPQLHGRNILGTNAGVTLRVLRGKRQLEVGGTSFRGVRLQRAQQTRTIDSAIAQVKDNLVEVVGKKHGCTRQVAAGVSGARIQLLQGALDNPIQGCLEVLNLTGNVTALRLQRVTGIAHDYV